MIRLNRALFSVMVDFLEQEPEITCREIIMKILYYDCFSGISGDMNLGALVDLGVNGEYLIQELSKLQLDSEYEIKIYKTLKMGISGTKVDVILKNKGHGHPQQLEERYHDGTGSPAKNKYEYHCHRNLYDIANIINGSGLNDRVKRLSLEKVKRTSL